MAYFIYFRSRSRILALQEFQSLDRVPNSLSRTTQNSFEDYSLKRKHPNQLDPISHTKKTKIKHKEGKCRSFLIDLY